MRSVMLARPFLRLRSAGALWRWGADRRGTTAIEFAFVAAPFFLLILGIMTVGLHFFTLNSLEHGVEAAARKIRTGQAQQSGMTLGDFRQLVCDEAGSYIKCNSNLVVHIKSGTTFTDLDPPTPCLTNGNLTASAGSATSPVSNSSGTASATVLVTACYQWDLGGSLWQGIWNLLTVGPWAKAGSTPQSAGKIVLQAATTFRTEPYQ
jgi:Flp pilus assembly protein TadG